MQRTQQHLRVAHRHVGMREADAAGLGQRDHLGDHFTLEADRQRAERMHVRLVQVARAKLEHLDEARLVEHGVGIRRAHEGRDATRDGRGHLGRKRRLVLVAGLAQPRAQVDEAGRDDQARRVDRPVCVETGRRRAERGDVAACDEYVGLLLGTGNRVDQRAAFDMNLHALSVNALIA